MQPLIWQVRPTLGTPRVQVLCYPIFAKAFPVASTWASHLVCLDGIHHTQQAVEFASPAPQSDGNLASMKTRGLLARKLSYCGDELETAPTPKARYAMTKSARRQSWAVWDSNLLIIILHLQRSAHTWSLSRHNPAVFKFQVLQ